MKLTFADSDGESSDWTRRKYPDGYWYAVTDDGGYDAVGSTPLNVVSKLVEQLEKVVKA